MSAAPEALLAPAAAVFPACGHAFTAQVPDALAERIIDHLVR